MTKIEKFKKLANVDEDGFSRWVNVNEFVEEYSNLAFGNGRDWARDDGTLGREFIIEVDKSVTPGNKIDRIRLNGRKKEDQGTNFIKSEIKFKIKNEKCLILGTSNPEVDHKNGRKDEARVMQNIDQKVEDFQALSKAANDAKRQFCKECKRTNKRFDAKRLCYPMSFYKGNENYDPAIGCKGCFWYDVKEFRNHLSFKK